jgi:hypothetical protein
MDHRKEPAGTAAIMQAPSKVVKVLQKRSLSSLSSMTSGCHQLLPFSLTETAVFLKLPLHCPIRNQRTAAVSLTAIRRGFIGK